MNAQMWNEMKDCFGKASTDPDVRSIVLSAKGRIFTAGKVFPCFIHRVL